jgi:molecular chaperone DnaK
VATKGDTHLGGLDFDYSIAKFVLPQVDDLSDVDKLNLFEVCDKSKRELTMRDKSTVNLKSVSPSFRNSEITYKEFKSCVSHLVTRTKNCVFECLKDAELEPSDIDKVYMVGGSTRMRMIPEMLSSLFAVPPETLNNPDEVVACGAAIHANDIYGTDAQVLLVDVMPLSLSVELEDGNCKKLVKRNTPIPCDAEEVFTTAYDNQEKVFVDIYQGEKELAKNNINLGRLELDNIEKALRGDPKILVRFSIDENAVISVSAQDLETDSSNEIELTYNFDEEKETEDDPTELSIVALKASIRAIRASKGIIEPLELTEAIDEAFELNNQELLQAVLEELQDLV